MSPSEASFWVIQSLVGGEYQRLLAHVSKLASKGTAWKVSKYGVYSDPYFPTFGLNTES